MKNTVLACYKQLLVERGISIDGSEISIDTTITRNNGLDSIGIVNFLMILEESLGKELDEVLTEIRNSKTLRDIADLLERIN
jgi:acyl carrier protein